METMRSPAQRSLAKHTGKRAVDHLRAERHHLRTPKISCFHDPSLVSACVVGPQRRHEHSMLLCSIPWAVVLHPGATQNGRLLGFYTRALRWTGRKENSDRQEATAQTELGRTLGVHMRLRVQQRKDMMRWSPNRQ